MNTTPNLIWMQSYNQILKALHQEVIEITFLSVSDLDFSIVGSSVYRMTFTRTMIFLPNIQCQRHTWHKHCKETPYRLWYLRSDQQLLRLSRGCPKNIVFDYGSHRRMILTIYYEFHLLLCGGQFCLLKKFDLRLPKNSENGSHIACDPKRVNKTFVRGKKKERKEINPIRCC